MTNKVKIGIVLGVGAATLAFLWHEHAADAATPDSPGATNAASTSSIAIPKPKPRRTVKGAGTTNVGAADEPFTQLQYDSAAALGYRSEESQAAADAEVSRALNEDLTYLGLGG